MIVCVETIIN